MQYSQSGGIVGIHPAENNNLPQWQKQALQSQWSGRGNEDGWRTPSPERNGQDEFTGGSFNTFAQQRSRYGMITDPDDNGLSDGNIQAPAPLMQLKVAASATSMTRRDSVSSESKSGIDHQLSRPESRDSDRHKRSRSRSRERSRDPQHSRSRPRSHSRERERRRSRSGSRSRKRRHSRSRSRSPNSQRKKSRRSKSPDDRYEQITCIFF